MQGLWNEIELGLSPSSAMHQTSLFKNQFLKIFKKWRTRKISVLTEYISKRNSMIPKILRSTWPSKVTILTAQKSKPNFHWFLIKFLSIWNCSPILHSLWHKPTPILWNTYYHKIDLIMFNYGNRPKKIKII